MKIYSSAGEGWSKPVSGKTALLWGNSLSQEKTFNPPGKKSSLFKSSIIKAAIGYTILRTWFPLPLGGDIAKPFKRTVGDCYRKQHGRPREFLTLVLPEDNTDNGLLPAIPSIQWQNFISRCLGQVCGAGVWISSSLDSAVQAWVHTGCCKHFSSSPTAATQQDCCCHLANFCREKGS